MNEAGYFPVPRPPTAAWGRISRVHRTWIQRWVNDGNDFPKATFLGNIRRQHPLPSLTHHLNHERNRLLSCTQAAYGCMGANFTGASYMNPTMGQRWQRFSEGNILRQHPKATPDAYREHIVEIMNETGYFPVPRSRTAAWGRISRVRVHKSNDGSSIASVGYELGLGSTVRFPKKNSARHPYPAGRTPPPYYTRGI